jgi:CHAD domain-containing protein
MHADENPRNLSGKGTIVETAAEQLNRRWKKLVKRGKYLDALNTRQRHNLRIEAKKLRYASEFFADVFPGKKAARRRKRFIAALKELQVCVGDLNDIVVNKRLSASLVSSPTAHERPIDQAWNAFAAGRLCGREEARFSSIMKAATRAQKAFAGATRFWN